MAIDRSKFRASSNQAVLDGDRAVAALTGKGQRGNADLLEVTEGRNRFRIFPVHPDGPEDATYSHPISKVFLPCDVDDKDTDGKVKTDAKGNPIKKRVQKPIFNSKVHGGTDLDLVEEYIKLARAKGDQIKDKDKRQAYLDKLYGKYNDNAAFRLNGINYSNTSAVYAAKLKGETAEFEKFGRLELKTSIKNGMNRVATTEGADDPMSVDPFSDANDGLPIIVTFNKQQKGGPKIKIEDMYITALDKNFGKDKRLIEYPLTDEQLEEFMKMPPLTKLFRNVFKKKDFDWQLQGLENFDTQYDMGIFATDEFLDIADKISEYYSDEPLKDEEVKETGGGVPDPEADEEPEEKGDAYDLMSRLDLKKLNASKRYGIVIKETMTDDQLRDKIRDAAAAAVIPHIPLVNDETGTDKIPPTEKEKAPDPVYPKPTGADVTNDRMSRLRGGRKPA